MKHILAQTKHESNINSNIKQDYSTIEPKSLLNNINFRKLQEIIAKDFCKVAKGLYEFFESTKLIYHHMDIDYKHPIKLYYLVSLLFSTNKVLPEISDNHPIFKDFLRKLFPRKTITLNYPK